MINKIGSVGSGQRKNLQHSIASEDHEFCQKNFLKIKKEYLEFSPQLINPEFDHNIAAHFHLSEYELSGVNLGGLKFGHANLWSYSIKKGDREF